MQPLSSTSIATIHYVYFRRNSVAVYCVPVTRKTKWQAQFAHDQATREFIENDQFTEVKGDML
jgi:hypothetical protein